MTITTDKIAIIILFLERLSLDFMLRLTENFGMFQTHLFSSRAVRGTYQFIKLNLCSFARYLPGKGPNGTRRSDTETIK